MKTSLIITTYNWKEALSLVLRSAFSQEQLPDEIVIGDDGSRPDTTELIRHFTPLSPVPVTHVWQEDIGFRAAKIRNRAIAAATGDYIVMIDGDMVLHPMFIRDHREVARSGFFVQGGRLLAGPVQTAKLLGGSDFVLNLFSEDVRNRKNTLNSRPLSRLCSFESRRLAGIRTCNFAVWRGDILRVNGFDEDYVGWGREDSDFALRLMNAGVRRYNLKFRANAIHLNHTDNSRANLAENDDRLQKAQEKIAVRCQKGIDQYL